MTRLRLVFLSVLNLLLTSLILTTRMDKLADNVWTIHLTGGGYLDYHTLAVALACPGVDYIRP